MRYFLALGVFLSFLNGKAEAYPPTPADIFTEIAVAFRAGNASEAARFFGGRVELIIGDKNNVYSKAQAQQVLNQFFKDHPPKKFNILHRGSSAMGARYAIGELTTRQDTYRAYFYLKPTNGSFLLQKISLETE